MNKLKVAILGSGNIGTDLLIKTLRSPHLECNLFVGRNPQSKGLAKAASLGIKTSHSSIDAIINQTDKCDLVFDATSAQAHIKHAPILKKLDKMVIDLTPSNIGEMCVPAIQLPKTKNVSMLTCGGQAAIPITHTIGTTYKHVEYIEVVSSIASCSAGPATRLNIDEYIETTEMGIMHFSNCDHAKAILILNPAIPSVDMQTTIFAKVNTTDLTVLTTSINAMVKKVQKYIPAYELISPPIIENGRIVIMIRIRGIGDHLPTHAGNLDIINCAAISIGEHYAKNFNK